MVRRRGRIRDVVAAGRWWPRWAERAAEQFGDTAGDGCHSSAVSTTSTRLARTWIAGGGGQVVRPFALLDERQPLDGGDRSRDLAGIGCNRRRRVDDRRRSDRRARAGTVRRAASNGGRGRTRAPAAIASFELSLLDLDLHGLVIEQLRLAIDDVVSDGVDVEVAFVVPPSASRRNHLGLVDRDIGLTAAGAVWLGELSNRDPNNGTEARDELMVVENIDCTPLETRGDAFTDHSNVEALRGTLNVSTRA